MNAYEEDLQKNIEKGFRAGGDDVDVRAYENVFRALKEDPEYQIPPNFAEKVLDRVVRKQEKALVTDYVWFIAGIIFVLSSSAVTMVLTGFRLDFGFLKTMSDYKGLAIFALFFILFINWLDKRIVRPKIAQP